MVKFVLIFLGLLSFESAYPGYYSDGPYRWDDRYYTDQSYLGPMNRKYYVDQGYYDDYKGGGGYASQNGDYLPPEYDYCPECYYSSMYPETNWADIGVAALNAVPGALNAYFGYKSSKDYNHFLNNMVKYQYKLADKTTSRYYDACTSLGLVCDSPWGASNRQIYGQGIGNSICRGAPGTCGGPFGGGFLGAMTPYGLPGAGQYGPGGPFNPNQGCFPGGPCFGQGSPMGACIPGTPCMGGGPFGPGGGGGPFGPGGGPFGPGGCNGICNGPMGPNGMPMPGSLPMGTPPFFPGNMGNVFGGPQFGMGCPGRGGCFGTPNMMPQCNSGNCWPGAFPPNPVGMNPAVPPWGGIPNGAGMYNPMMGMNGNGGYGPPHRRVPPGYYCGLRNWDPCRNEALRPRPWGDSDYVDDLQADLDARRRDLERETEAMKRREDDLKRQLAEIEKRKQAEEERRKQREDAIASWREKSRQIQELEDQLKADAARIHELGGDDDGDIYLSYSKDYPDYYPAPRGSRGRPSIYRGGK